MAKNPQIKQQGQKWAHLRKEYLNFDWAYDTKIWMTDVQGGDILASTSIFPNCQFLLSYYMLKNAPN